jgi:hypothetical protein
VFAEGHHAWKELMRRYDDSLRAVVFKQLGTMAERLQTLEPVADDELRAIVAVSSA